MIADCRRSGQGTRDCQDFVAWKGWLGHSAAVPQSRQYCGTAALCPSHPSVRHSTPDLAARPGPAVDQQHLGPALGALGRPGLGLAELVVLGPAVGHAMDEPARRLDAAGDEHVALTGADRVGRHADRLERRRAVAVHGDATGLGDAGEQGSLGSLLEGNGFSCARPPENGALGSSLLTWCTAVEVNAPAAAGRTATQMDGLVAALPDVNKAAEPIAKILALLEQLAAAKRGVQAFRTD